MPWPPNSPDLNPIEHQWIKHQFNRDAFAEPTNPIHGGPTLQLAGLKRSAANDLVQETTEHVERSCGVHALTHQSCFGSMRGTYIGQVILMLWLLNVRSNCNVTFSVSQLL